MSNDREQAIPLFIDVHDVMGSMKVSRSRAYSLMRAALGRMPGERGLLRVPLSVWLRYVSETFDPEVRAAGRDPRSVLVAGRAPVAVTLPRTRTRALEEREKAGVLQSPRVTRKPTPC